MDYNYNNNNNNMNYYTPNARYYQNNGNPNNQGGNVNGDFYSNNDNSYTRSPQYSENHAHNLQYINYPPANYNNYDGGGRNPDHRNEYNNFNIKPTSPGGSEHGDSGYSDPHNISSRSNARYKNPHNIPFDDTKPSYNTPYHPSPTKYPSSPVMPGMNPTYPPISPTPVRQVPYGGRPADNYNEGASSKEMYSSSMPSSNLGPTNHGQISPTSAYSTKPFLEYEDDDDDKRPKPGGLMKIFCCGGRVTCCRVCVCVCCIIFVLIILVVVAAVLWGRPPKVSFLGIIPSPIGLPAYNSGPTGFDFNLGLQIQVDNPNIVGANFKMIKAVAFYPGHPDAIGGGNMTDVSIGSKKNTTIDFPFSVNYNKDIDPGFAILFDIAQKCGLTGGGEKQQLQIDYKLSLTLNVLVIPINLPDFNRKAMIDCPIKDGQIPNIPGFDIGKAAKDFGKSGKRKKRDLDLILTPKKPA